MIQPTYANSVESSSFSDSTAFTVQADSSLFSILTSKVYNDTILAPIRELSTNAVDACKMSNLPIKFDVHLPTQTELTFSVRDYAAGLPPEDLIGLFTVVGASTKRDSNDTNGTLGIGRLSPLAYTDSFTVESFYDGQHHQYLIATTDGIPTSTHLGTFPTTEPTGLKVSFSVESHDVHKFNERAKKLYRYFEHKPSLNLDLDISFPSKSVEFDSWFTIEDNWNNFVLMSDVLYSIDSNHIQEKGFRGAVLKIPTGAITINPGRESLSYDPGTIKVLNAAFESAAEELISETTTKISNEPIVYKKLEILHAASKSSPFSLNIANFPDLSHLATGQGYLKLPFAATVKVKNTYYKSLQDIHMSVRDLVNHDLVLIDLSTRFAHIYSELTNTTIIVSRPTGTKMEDFIANAKSELTSAGIPFKLASSFDPAPERESKSESRTSGIYVSHVSSWGVSKSEHYNPSLKYAYVPISGTSHTLSEDEIKAYQLVVDILPTRVYFVGVPKKYIELAKEHPNFTPAKEYLQAQLDQHEFTILPSDRSCYYNRSRYPTFACADLKAYYATCDEYLNKDFTYINKSTCDTIESQFTITSSDFDTPVTHSDINLKYPDYFKLVDNRYLHDGFIDRYLYLEQHHANTSHQDD